MGAPTLERHAVHISRDHEVTGSYDQLNYLVSSDREVNQMYLRTTELHMNQLLLIRGYVFLNEVLGYLHIPITAEGQVTGWTQGPVDLGIDFSPDPDDDPEIAFVIKHEGFILDLLPS